MLLRQAAMIQVEAIIAPSRIAYRQHLCNDVMTVFTRLDSRCKRLGNAKARTRMQSVYHRLGISSQLMRSSSTSRHRDTGAA